jgi:hypothetical protein
VPQSFLFVPPITIIFNKATKKQNAAKAFKLGIGLKKGILKKGILKKGILKKGILKKGILKRGILQRGILKRGILY